MRLLPMKNKGNSYQLQVYMKTSSRIIKRLPCFMKKARTTGRLPGSMSFWA